jgi:hypothetical protein
MITFNKIVLAGILSIGLGGATVFGCTPGNSCAGPTCNTIQCKDNELASWCRVEITTPNCAMEQPFGFCLPTPKNGFPPNTDVTTWIWTNAPALIRPMVKDSFGTNVGFDILQCKAGAANPFPGSLPNNESITLIAVSNDLFDKKRDEAQCEACASASCNLNACGSDANCSCWVQCAFADATLATCPSKCGGQGAVTTDLVKCLVTTCGPACGVASSLPSCDQGAGGSSTTTCGQSGDMCGSPGDPNCCGICGLDNLCE